MQKSRLLRCDNFSTDSSQGKFATSGAGPQHLKCSILTCVWAVFVSDFCSNWMLFSLFFFFFFRIRGIVEVTKTDSLAAVAHFQQSYRAQ